MSDEKFTTYMLQGLTDDDVEALDEYGAAVSEAAGDKRLKLSRQARVRALFRLGVESWRGGSAGKNKSKTKSSGESPRGRNTK